MPLLRSRVCDHDVLIEFFNSVYFRFCAIESHALLAVTMLLLLPRGLGHLKALPLTLSRALPGSFTGANRFLEFVIVVVCSCLLMGCNYGIRRGSWNTLCKQNKWCAPLLAISVAFESGSTPQHCPNDTFRAILQLWKLQLWSE